MKERCLACGKLLFGGPLFHKNGFGTVELDDRLDLDYDNGACFFRCPHCSAKNVVIEAVTPLGLPGLRISHVVA